MNERATRAEAEVRVRDHQNMLMMLEILRGILEKSDSQDEIAALDLAADVTEEEIVSHPVFLSAHPEYRLSPQRGLASSGDSSSATTDTALSKVSVLSNKDYGEAALRAAVSIGIEKYTENSIARGVKYEMGAKNGQSIDCSGFVNQAIKQMAAERPGVCNVNISAMFTTHSDGQLDALVKETNFLLKGDDVNISTIKAGMVIGIDSGNKGWDGGRARGIDHVGIVYADKESGKLMFAESRGGVGVMATPLEDWLKTAEKRNYSLYASDLVKLASDDYKQRLEQNVRSPDSVAQATETTLPPKPETTTTAALGKPA